MKLTQPWKMLAILGGLVASMASHAGADVVCADSSYCEVVFNRTYPSTSQFAGQPYDYLTVSPDGQGETFANANGEIEGDGLLDIEVRVYLRNCSGEPLVGVPPQQINLFNSALCICPGGAIADAGGTDVNGCATFTGTLAAGGCVESIDVFADGVFIGTLMDESGRTVKTNSFDSPLMPSPCFVDAGDLAYLALVFRAPAADSQNVCMDFNERSPTIDASDVAAFAAALAATCQ